MMSTDLRSAMGEFKVHRVRFFDYMPSGIRALAFNRDTERMAVARIDGSVEVFHCSDRFFQEKVRSVISIKLMLIRQLCLSIEDQSYIHKMVFDQQTVC